MKRLKIIDWYCHQGAQYELFKLPHDFYLMSPDGSLPKWNTEHRPLHPNVHLVSEKMIKAEKFDVMIVRSPVHKEKYKPHFAKKISSVAVIQTTTPFDIPKECKHVVWNSLDVMEKFQDKFPKHRHYYIVHGFDPDEFQKLDLPKRGRILTVANCFKSRGSIMGYKLWSEVFQEIKEMDVIGHGNTDIYRRDKQAKTFRELINIYNSYTVFLNPTQQSAMPRSRGEALMCGCPVITTNNYDIGHYLKHKEHAFLSNNKLEIISAAQKFLSSEAMCQDYGSKGREAAIEHFHIKDYLSKWEQVLEEL